MAKSEKKNSNTLKNEAPASAFGNNKGNMLVKRLLSALVMAVLAIGVLMLGDPFVYLFALIIGTLLVWEWANMIPNKGHSLSYMVALATTIFVSIKGEGNDISVYGLSIVFAMIAAVTAFVWFKSKDEKWRKLLTFGVPYIAIGIGSVIWFYELVGVEWVLWLLVVVWSTDIGGYLIGSTVKGPKLAPKISPNKTWSGLFGAVLLASGASYLLLAWLDDGSNGDISGWFVKWSIIAAAVAVVSQIGDLAESAVKRALKLKDSSNLIPGHGGVFDRIDGLLFAAPFICVLLYLL